MFLWWDKEVFWVIFVEKFQFGSEKTITLSIQDFLKNYNVRSNELLIKIYEKLIFATPWYAHLRNIGFLENFVLLPNRSSRNYFRKKAPSPLPRSYQDPSVCYD